jgi:phage gp29-like protein
VTATSVAVHGEELMAIVDINGNPIQSVVLHEQQTSQLGWLKSSYEEHPSMRLTPEKLYRILEAAELGYLLPQSDLFTDMEEKDSHIFAEMSKRKRVLLTLDWDVLPPRDASPTEKKLAAWVRECLQDMMFFEDMLLDTLDALGHGFSALEITWAQLGGMWLPQAVTRRPQRWFMTPWNDRDDIRLRGLDVMGQSLWPFGWIMHRHRAKSGYVSRSGLHRVLVWPYLFKNYGVRDCMEFLEIYGIPLRLGKYPGGSTEDDKRALLRAVTNIGHDAAGIIPQDMTIDFKEAASGSGHSPHLQLIDYMERSQSKVILGGTLTSQADGKSSTHALGNVHNEVRHDLMVSDARQLEATLTRDLIYPIVALNKGVTDVRRLPRLVFETREPEDMKLFADSIPKLVAMGMPIPTGWAREKLSIPAADGDEPILAIPQPLQTLPPEFRPAPAPGANAGAAAQQGQAALSRTAPITYRRVVTNSRGEVIYPDQHQLDETVEDLSAASLAAGMDKLLAPVIQAIRRGETQDAAIEALLAAHPDMDDTAIAELLARAMFVADIWGRVNGD